MQRSLLQRDTDKWPSVLLTMPLSPPCSAGPQESSGHLQFKSRWGSSVLSSAGEIVLLHVGSWQASPCLSSGQRAIVSAVRTDSNIPEFIFILRQVLTGWPGPQRDLPSSVSVFPVLGLELNAILFRFPSPCVLWGYNSGQLFFPFKMFTSSAHVG